MFAPHISSNRVEESFEKNEIEFNKSGSGLRFSAGPVLDFYLQDNIALTFGALYSVKRASFEFSTSISEAGKSSKISPILNLQYASIPVGLKFITNDIASKARLYFQLGGNLDIKIAENIQNKEDVEKHIEEGEFKEDFAKAIDAGLNLGTGIELDLGSSNSVFLGINYNRGLINVLTKDFGNNLKDDITNGIEINKEKIKFNNDLFSLVAGFRF